MKNSLIKKISIFAIIFWLATPAMAEVIKIAFTQVPDLKVAQESSAKLAKLIREKTKLDVETIVVTDYSSVIELLKKQQVQFAFLNPATFVKLEQEGLVKVLLKKVWEGPFYYSTVLVPKNSVIKSLKDLKGKTVAFVDSKSTSGYLAPLVGMQKHKIKLKDLKNVVFAGGHAAAVELLKQNKADAIAVFSDSEDGSKNAWDKYAGNTLQKVKTIWVSEPISNDPFVVSRSFYESSQPQVLSIMLALMEISASSGSEKFSELIGNQALMPATSQHYESVKKLLEVEEEQNKK